MRVPGAVRLPILLTLLACLVAELGLRGYEVVTGREVVGTGPVVEDPDVGFVLSPRYRGDWWDTRIELDEWGFRNGRSTAASPPAVRVLSLGDSTTFGVSVPAERSYSSVLQSLLDDRQPGRFEVVNAGVPGYSSREARRQVERKGLLERTRPDIVTVYLGWNDHWLARAEPAPERELGRLRRLKARLLERSALLRVADHLRVRIYRWALARLGREARRREVTDLLERRTRGERPSSEATPLNVSPSEFAENLAAIIAGARSHDASPILIVPPEAIDELVPAVVEAHPLAPLPFFFHDEYQDVIRRVGRERGVAVLDLPRRFASESPAATFGDPVHPNEAGHRIIAEEIAAAVAGSGIGVAGGSL